MKKKNKVVFRADGNHKIGLGHVVRCLALAEMLKEDFSCLFAISHPSDYLKKEILSVCDAIIELDEDKHWDDFLTFIQDDEIVVLDNYFFDTDYQKAVKLKCKKLVCIDDFTDKHFVADAVICQGASTKEEDYSRECYTKLYLGLRYALLRKPFRDQIKETRELPLSNAAFVCFGGSDFYNLTQKTVDVLLAAGITVINVIIGAAYMHTATLEKYKGNAGVKIYHSISAQAMLEVMKASSFAVVPASSIILELFTVGVPVICGYYADNQIEGAKALAGLGLAFNCGNLLNDYEQKLSGVVQEMLAGKGNGVGLKQKAAIGNAQPLYLQIFKSLSDTPSQLEIHFNKGVYEFINFVDLTDDEKKIVWQWRNHESIRQWMTNKDFIPFENHLFFLESLKSDITKKYWLVRRKGQNIGAYYVINIANGAGESGYYLAPEFHDRNYGAELCYFAFYYVFNIIGMLKLYGFALVSNRGANSLSRLFGFSEKPVTKIVDNQSLDYYYGELTSEIWDEKIKHNKKIEKIILFSLSK